jgi:hypothetical protein
MIMTEALFCVMAGFLVVASGASAAELRACFPDYQGGSLSSPEGDAAAQRIIALAARRQGDDVQFLVAPWTRCVAGMGSGQYDLLVGAEADQELQSFVAFPEKSGRPDSTRRLGSTEYVLVHKSAVQAAPHDRGAKEDPESVIVPTSAYAATRRLLNGGVRAKLMNYDASRFVSLLCHDRADMVVLRRKDFAPALPLCQPTQTILIQSYSIAVADVYLGVRRSLLLARPELAESIWREIERLRSTPDAAADFLAADRAR